ncbi:hypothetical protein [Paraburkholderia sediminicola]|uniref:hypothetical protein n=1 Tax=Paraburkholderia sediminicola TaxID=458836 RepID=UPI0038BD9D2D
MWADDHQGLLLVFAFGGWGSIIAFLGFGLRARGLFVWLPTAMGFFLIWLLSILLDLFACVALYACGVGLSLFCYWCISVAPVRGGTYFSLPPQREVSKRKRLTPLILKRVPRAATVVVHLESVFSHTPR